jgi:hypothetical protein
MMRYRRRPASLSSEAREMNRSFPAFFAGDAESLRKLVNLTITLRERFPRRECQENGPNPGEIGAANLGRLWGRTAALSNHAASSGAVLFCSCPNLNSRVS